MSQFCFGRWVKIKHLHPRANTVVEVRNATMAIGNGL